MRKIEVGMKFQCEKMFYVVTRGCIYCDGFYYSKSKNLQVQRLDWAYDRTDINPIDDFKNREYFMVDVYKLEPVGLPRKFVTITRDFDLVEFEEGRRVVAWFDKKERETNKGRKRFDKTFFKRVA